MLGEYSSTAVKADHTATVMDEDVAVHRRPQQCVRSKRRQITMQWWVEKIMAKIFAQDGSSAAEQLARRRLMLGGDICTAKEIFALQRRPQQCEVGTQCSSRVESVGGG